MLALATEELMKNPGFGPRHPPSANSSAPGAAVWNNRFVQRILLSVLPNCENLDSVVARVSDMNIPFLVRGYPHRPVYLGGVAAQSEKIPVL